MNLFARSMLLVLTLMFLCTSPAGALSFTYSPWAFTENFGSNSAGFVEGHYFHVGALVNDSNGVPGNITSVYADNSDPTQPDYALPYFDVGSIYSGMYEVLTPYDGQLGQWAITVENQQNDRITGYTNMMTNVHVIPLATNLAVSESGTTQTITWDSVLYDHDYDPDTPDVEVDNYRIRLVNASSDQFWQSNRFLGNSLTLPEGLLVPGETYIRLQAMVRGGERSSTFTQYPAAPVPEPGTVLLLGAGMAGFAAIRKRKR